MPTLCKQDDCTSCLACYNACPFGAISILENDLSVIVPNIDNEKCKECGVCEKACPILKSPEFRQAFDAFALYTKNDKDRLTCSSGGAATTFSRVIIERDGVVYGASAKGSFPQFIRVSQASELELLKGSKYVYCNPNLIYQQVKNDLSKGFECLFIGLPCNVAGLKNYLRKDYERLITIDLICHGAPPFEYLKQHLESKIGMIDKDSSIMFRGNRDFYTTVYDAQGKIIYSQNQYEDEYFVAFMHGWMYRQSCYKCQYARSKRVSDITIGDFWGLKKGALDGYTGKISLTMINTLKGKQLFQLTQDNFIWESRSVDEAIRGNMQLRKPTHLSKQAEIFHNTYKTTGSVYAAFKTSGVLALVQRNKLRRTLLAMPKKVIHLLKS